jgi:hypothetical protein
MKIRAVVRWLLVLGIAVGVAIGPAVPSMAATRTALTTTMTAVGTDEDAMQMADEMPCCPKQQAPMRFDCDKCAFANCMSKLSVPDQVSAIMHTPTIIRRIAPVSEFAPAGLAKPPPERPPRTTV